MNDTVKVDKGEALSMEIVWGEDSIAGHVIEVIEASPVALLNATVTILDADERRAVLALPSAQAADLRRGRSNWLRLGLMLNGEVIDSTPRIWLEVT